MPRVRDRFASDGPELREKVCARAAMVAGWLVILAILSANSTFAEGGKPPRSFPKYTVEVIYGVVCPPVGYEPISGRSINANGIVAGQLTACPQNKEAFLYPAGGGPLFIMPRPPGFSNAYGAAVNDLNWLVGRITQTGVGNLGFVHKPDGSVTLIPPPPEGTWCEALGVNNAGVVVGFWHHNVTGAFHLGYCWENGIRTDLTELPGPKSEAYDISESGLITGWTGNSILFDAQAFVWNDSEVVLLPPIPGGITSQGYSVNDKGDICGRGRIFVDALGTHKWRAFAYIDGEMIAIPPLPGYTDHTSALSINSHGQVVGGSGWGFIWQDNEIASLQDLVVGPPGLEVYGASAINNAGQIVASGSFDDTGDEFVFVLTPIVPPPGDLDGDGIVNGVDLALLLAAWGPCRRACSSDLDGNDVVNGIDLAMLLAGWTS